MEAVSYQRRAMGGGQSALGSRWFVPARNIRTCLGTKHLHPLYCHASLPAAAGNEASVLIDCSEGRPILRQGDRLW